MARIELRSLEHRYESSRSGESSFAIEDLNLAWEDGTANALLGPSGCGKTTILNIISGLIRPTGGEVRFDGVRVNERQTRERHIAQVFQYPVVYDTMTVFDNLAFPLRNTGLERAEVRRRANEILELLELGEFSDTKANRLSPAEKQIVSLGRGIVRKDTAAVLLDEPLTVIDPMQRHDLRRKLRRVQQELELTMVYVTHDQHEALTFADHVTIVKDGELIQTATPEELFRHPATPFVGYFIGSPGMNLMRCERRSQSLEISDVGFPCPKAVCDKAERLDGTIDIGVRPQFVETSFEERPDWLALKLKSMDHTGAYQILTLESGALEIKAQASEENVAIEGDTVWVNFPPECVNLYLDGKLVRP